MTTEIKNDCAIRRADAVSQALTESRYRNMIQATMDLLDEKKPWQAKPMITHCEICSIHFLVDCVEGKFLEAETEGKIPDKVLVTVLSSTPQAIRTGWALRILSVEGVDYKSFPYTREQLLEAVIKYQEDAHKKAARDVEDYFDLLESMTLEFVVETVKANPEIMIKAAIENAINQWQKEGN